MAEGISRHEHLSSDTVFEFLTSASLTLLFHCAVTESVIFPSRGTQHLFTQQPGRPDFTSALVGLALALPRADSVQLPSVSGDESEQIQCPQQQGTWCCLQTRQITVALTHKFVPYRAFIAGGVAACGAVTVTHSFETVKIRYSLPPLFGVSRITPRQPCRRILICIYTKVCNCRANCRPSRTLPRNTGVSCTV